jgi:hypothetical protein
VLDQRVEVLGDRRVRALAAVLAGEDDSVRPADARGLERLVSRLDDCIERHVDARHLAHSLEVAQSYGVVHQ